MLHLLAAHGFHFHDLFHPVRYWGYQFWSGIGSDIAELAILGWLVGAALWVLHHFQCHTEGCRRIGPHRVAGTPYRVCWHHHPELGLHKHHKIALHRIHRMHYDHDVRSRDQRD